MTLFRLKFCFASGSLRAKRGVAVTLDHPDRGSSPASAGARCAFLKVSSLAPLAVDTSRTAWEHFI